MICPQCQAELLRAPTAKGLLWTCRACGGRGATLPVLRTGVVAPYLNRLWQAAREGEGGSRVCPACRAPMVRVAMPDGARHLDLDVCRTCQLVWFDGREHEALPSKPAPTSPEEELPEEAREILARARAEAVTARFEQRYGARPPEEWWRWLFGALGLPVERDGPPLWGRPLATWSLAALTAAVSLIALLQLDAAIARFGLVPARAWRYGGATLLTSFFLHAGLLHLAGNLYFLLVFGDNVEDVLGSGRFLLLVALSAIAGGLLHLLLDPRPEVPVVGASAGISGVVLFYPLTFPRARLGMFWRFVWITMPVWAYVGLWVLLQLIVAWAQLQGASNVSALGHLGGAGVGAAFFLSGAIGRSKGRPADLHRSGGGTSARHARAP